MKAPIWRVEGGNVAPKRLSKRVPARARKARAAAHLEAGQTFNPAVFKTLCAIPPVVSSFSSGASATSGQLQQLSNRYQRIGAVRQTKRCPTDRAPVQSACPNHLCSQSRPNHAQIAIRQAVKSEEFLPRLD
jgi:hypothetical protein